MHRSGTDPRRPCFAVLAHVDATTTLVVEEELGERLGQFGLADTRGSEEEERARRPVRVADAGARAAHRIGHRLHGVFWPISRLPSSARGTSFARPQQASDGDAGPRSDDGGDIGIRHLVAHHPLAALGASAFSACATCRSSAGISA
jgi:hypothetical protein